MSRLSFAIASRAALVFATVVHPAACDEANATAQSAGQPARAVSQARENAARLMARIRRADYEGDREELRRLVEELRPVQGDVRLASRVHYWRGFALWRRAFNGFNVPADREDLAADLGRAVAEFEKALSFDPAFVDPRVGTLSCLQSLAFLHREDGAKLAEFVKRFVPLFEELSTSAADNPRFLWVQGASLWYALPGLSDAQIAERRARALAGYERGVRLARNAPAPADPLEPAWGEPELLMSLAWSYLNASKPDLTLAETHARNALALVPYWQYVRDILLPRIEQAQAQRRLDAFVAGRRAAGRMPRRLARQPAKPRASRFTGAPRATSGYCPRSRSTERCRMAS